ncbi:MAG TPA: ankyrin repeat domain-containing protein [Anaerolineales bacterium]|nr:ankyrin repeat domain-containing protein [Anaerolineales bacterium]
MSIGFFDAIRQGNRYEVERQLIVDPNLIHVRENGLSPVLVAAYYHEPEIASFLADKAIILSIFEAAATGKINHVIRLLARDPQLVNAYAEDGFQPLGLACFFGHHDTAEYLAKAGAPINSPSRNELNAAPIHSAAAGRHHKIVKMLLDLGALPNVREQGGFTPLHAAAQNGDVETILALLLGGADLTLKSDGGKIPLDLAIDAGHEKAAALLGEGVTKRFKNINE